MGVAALVAVNICKDVVSTLFKLTTALLNMRIIGHGRPPSSGWQHSHPTRTAPASSTPGSWPPPSEIVNPTRFSTLPEHPNTLCAVMDDNEMKAMMMNIHIAAAEIAGDCGGAEGIKEWDTPGLIPFPELRSRYGRRFQRAARMSEPCFLRLVEIVRPHMRRHDASLASQVFVALRIFAGASYLDVCDATGVSAATFYEIVWEFSDAVFRAPAMKKRMPLWEVARRQQTAAGFQKRGDSPLNNIIGALDGIAIRRERPSLGDVTCPKDYWCRKGFSP